MHTGTQGPEGREGWAGECQSQSTGYSVTSHCLTTPLTPQLFSMILIQASSPGINMQRECTLYVYLLICCVWIYVFRSMWLCSCRQCNFKYAFNTCASVESSDYCMHNRDCSQVCVWEWSIWFQPVFHTRLLIGHCVVCYAPVVSVWCLFRARSLICDLSPSLLSQALPTNWDKAAGYKVNGLRHLTGGIMRIQ